MIQFQVADGRETAAAQNGWNLEWIGFNIYNIRYYNSKKQLVMYIYLELRLG